MYIKCVWCKDAEMLARWYGTMQRAIQQRSNKCCYVRILFYIYEYNTLCIHKSHTRYILFLHILHGSSRTYIIFFRRDDGWNAKIDIWLHRLLNTCAAEKVHGVYTLHIYWYIYIVHKFLGKNSYFAVRMKWSPLHFSAVILLPSSA